MPSLRACLALAGLSLLLVAGTLPAKAADLTCPLVFTQAGNVLFLAPGAAKARKLGRGRAPALSPDGKRAVWIESGKNPEMERLVLYDLDAGTTTPLTRAGDTMQSPRFVLDGQAVVFSRLGKEAVQELWLVRPGEAPTRLARAGGEAGNDFFEPMWFSADGAIGYHDMHHLFVLRPDGTPVRTMPLATLAPGQENMFTSADRMAASPDGATLVFSLSVPGTPLFRKKVPDTSNALFLFDTRTGKSTPLTPPSLTAFAPAWTPDGQAVVFTGYTDVQAGGRDPFRIWIVQPGGQPVDLGKGEDAMPPAGR